MANLAKRSAQFVVALLAGLIFGCSPGFAGSILGTTGQTFAVLGHSTVTNTGSTTITGDIGVSPGSAITGLGSITLTGTSHAADATAAQAQTDITAADAMLDALPFTTDLSGQDLGGKTLTPGVYFFSSSAGLTGVLTLDFQGNSSKAFVFQIGSTLTTASSSSVVIKNPGSNEGVFFDVGSSATLGTSTLFEGNIIADASDTLTTGASIGCGRALALTGAVTMDTNSISNSCESISLNSQGLSGGFAPAPPVPEPASVVLMGSGLLGLAFARKRAARMSQMSEFTRE